MSATLWTYDEGDDGILAHCRRSVSLGTDLSMADIENLQTEITELRKEMSLRDAKLRQITDGELAKEGSENAISPTFPCKSQSDSILITWHHGQLGEEQHHGNPGEDHHMLPKVKEEPDLAEDPILITWHHDNPAEAHYHGKPGENQHMLPKVKKEPGLDAVCTTELNCLQTHLESYLCQPKLENVVTVHKNEPAPIEITISVHDGGLQHAMQCFSDPNPIDSLGSLDCNGGDQHTLQIPLKTCSVRLVDCRKMLERNGNTTRGNLEDEPSHLASDLSSMSSGQTSNMRSAKHLHNIKELSLASTRNIKHRKLQSEEKNYSCASYIKQVINSSSHGSDQSVQDEERAHWCSNCGRSFTTDFNLHRHLKLHAGEKPYRCSHCGKHFSQLFNLMAHQRVHTGEKPFQCSVCKKHFSQASKLKTHKRIHTGEKPYICHACGKGFSDSSTYHKHQRIHTGERPYACSICGKCFGQSAHLLKHNISHNRKPYSCSTCGKNFSKPLSLIKHTTLHTCETSTNQPSANI